MWKNSLRRHVSTPEAHLGHISISLTSEHCGDLSRCTTLTLAICWMLLGMQVWKQSLLPLSHSGHKSRFLDQLHRGPSHLRKRPRDSTKQYLMAVVSPSRLYGGWSRGLIVGDPTLSAMESQLYVQCHKSASESSSSRFPAITFSEVAERMRFMVIAQ
jgi:hypothetical protein